MHNIIVAKASFETDQAGTITGIAWPYGSPDRVGDVIVPGAFVNTPDKLPMLYNHSEHQTIGVWDSITDTVDALHVAGKLLINEVARANEVHAIVKSQAATGLSIRFRILEAKPRKPFGRTITHAELLEISIVPIPAHPGARIIAAKAAQPAKPKEGRLADEDHNTIDDSDFETRFFTLEESMKSLNTIPDTLGKFSSRLDKIEARLSRPGSIHEHKPANADETAAKAFDSFARHGIERMPQDEAKALMSGIPADGGHLIPKKLEAEILKNLTLYSPLREISRVVQVGLPEVVIPKRTSLLGASWVGETEQRSNAQSAYDVDTYTVFEMACYTDISNRLLEDAQFDLQSQLSSDLSEAFGQAEGLALVKGDGNKKPFGLLTNGEIPALPNVEFSGVGAGDLLAGLNTYLIELFHALPSAYAKNGVWIMNRRTTGNIRALASASGESIWSDSGLANGNPPNLLGRPVIEVPDMPDFVAPDGTTVSGAIPIAFGDFRQGFRIFDRLGLSILRDPYSAQQWGLVRFHARRRVGAAVVKPEAIRFLKLVQTI